jgi:AraC-like DNA-binding protein
MRRQSGSATIFEIAEYPGLFLKIQFPVQRDLVYVKATLHEYNLSPVIAQHVHMHGLGASSLALQKPGYLPRCMSILYSMLAQIDELTNSATPSSKSQLIREAVRYLEMNYTDAGLSIGDLAQAAWISEVYFRRLFSEVYHTSPSRYLRNVRIDKAKDLLTGDYSSNEEIARSVGYSPLSTILARPFDK